MDSQKLSTLWLVMIIDSFFGDGLGMLKIIKGANFEVERMGPIVTK